MFNGRTTHRRVPVWTLMIFLLAASKSVRAESGTSADLPPATVKMKNGLAVHVDTHWVDANGYRPIRVKLTPVPSPAAADRTIRVEIHANDQGGPRATMIASQYIEIPQGSRGVEATIPLPQRRQCFSVAMEFSENGRHLKDLDWQGSMLTGQWFWTEATPTVLFIDTDTPPRSVRSQQVSAPCVGAKLNNSATPDALPDVRVVASILPTWPQVDLGVIDVTQRFGDTATLSLLESYPRLAMLPPAELPERCVEFSCFDVVMISLGDLRKMVSGEPKKWQALRDWIATGATLCVYDAGEEFERLAELEKLLALSPLAGEKSGPRGWQAPQLKDRDNKVTAVRDVGANYYQQNQMIDPTTGQIVNKPKPTATTATESAPNKAFFVMRKLGLGRVIAIGPADPFPGSAWQWSWMFNSIGAQNLMWYQRHGMSLNRENNDFWSFLIPGVGRPPVLTFLVLISLFMIAVGPINYMMLRRRSRLYLLLVTVPAAAGLVTISLLAYAVLSDGLGVRVRVRSFTQIDQTNAHAVSWSRQSYYAGVAPSRGLSFPTDTVVYSLEDHPEGRYNRRSFKTRSLEWGEQQHLASGYMSSRTTTQFLAVRSRASASKIVVDEAADGMSSPQVHNQIGTTLSQLLLCDANGDLHWGEKIEPDTTVRLAPIEPKVAQATLAALVRNSQPKTDEGDAYVNTGWRNYSYYNNVDNSLPGALMATSILENHLQPLAANASLQLKPRSYVAIVKSSPEVPLGVPAAKEEASFHVIAGNW